MVSRKIIAAIGNFDGVHLGHQYLLRETAKFAAEHGAAPGVVVFDPHPRRYFRPDDPPFLITTPDMRNDLLKTHDAAEVFSLEFNESLASRTPEEFVRGILKGKLGLAGAVTGADFQFGKGRAGNGAALLELGAAADLKIRLVDVLSENPQAEKFGSSLVRQALSDGAPRRAAAMLGRSWSVFGKVVVGQKLGRTLGFPTANFTMGDLIEPRNGVYATRVRFDGKSYNAVSNFGRRPTVGSDEPLLETHLFDFDGDLYGKAIEVAFIDFIRDEQKFDGLDALQAQISADCKKARQLLA